MVVSAIIVIKGLGHYSDKGLADVISQEVAEVED